MTPTTAKHEFNDAVSRLAAGLRTLPEFLDDLRHLSHHAASMLQPLTAAERAEVFAGVGVDLCEALGELNAAESRLIGSILKLLAVVAGKDAKDVEPAEPAKE